jgi:hypothetical protein
MRKWDTGRAPTALAAALRRQPGQHHKRHSRRGGNRALRARFHITPHSAKPAHSLHCVALGGPAPRCAGPCGFAEQALCLAPRAVCQANVCALWRTALARVTARAPPALAPARCRQPGRTQTQLQRQDAFAQRPPGAALHISQCLSAMVSGTSMANHTLSDKRIDTAT